MKKILTLLLFYLINDCLIAQISNYDSFFQSPEVSALTKEVQTPVSLSSGTLGIEIPLHELRCGDIKVPISLSYDATGIRAEAHPSWVGLNWNLKAGGKITRVVKGDPDEKDAKISIPGADREYSIGYFYWKSLLDNPAWNQENTLLLWTSDVFVPDLEPDEFIFNFCGQSGVFYANTNGKYVVKGLKGYTITSFQQVLPWNPIDDDGREQICFAMSDSEEWTSGESFKMYVNYILGFKVVDPNGFTYYFGFGDTTLSTNDCYTRDFSEVEVSANLFKQEHTPEINAWNLMKIVSPTGNTVTFEYKPGPPQAQLNKQFSYNAQQFDRTSGFHGLLGFFNGTSTIKYPGASQLMYAGDIIMPSYLTRIVSDAETVEFTHTPTHDLTYDFNKIYDNLYYYKIISDDLCFKLSINSRYGYIDWRTGEYIFWSGYTYPTYYVETYVPRGPWWSDMAPGQGYHLASFLSKSGQKLDSIHISTPSAYGKDVINFTFDYIDRPTSRLQLSSIHSNGLPMYDFIYNGTCDIPYASGRSDHWGYINSNDINSYANYFENYFKYKYDNTISDYKPDTSALKSFYKEREPTTGICYGGYLTGIKYPTGGTKKFVFEPNTYSKVITRNASTGDLSIEDNSGTGGGLRIAEIIENDTKSTTTTSYEYSGGILNGAPQYYFSNTGKYYTSFGDTTSFSAKRFISSSTVPVSTNPDFSSVSYSKVIEKQEGNGRVEYTFSNHDTDTTYLDKNSEGIITLTKTVYTPLTSRVNMRGKLLEKKTFGQGDTTVKVETLSYELLDDEYIKAVSLHRESYSPSGIVEMFYRIEGGAYRIYTAPYALKTNIEQDVYQSGTVSDTTSYTSDQWYQIATKTETGNGKTTTNKLKYPYNYDDAVYGEMVSRNMISPVIEQITTRSDNVIAAQRTDYMLNGLLLPSSTYSLNTALPISQSSYSQYYSKDLNFDQYNSHGNILQYTGRDSIPITFLWSYNSQYPIAKIKNATYGQVKLALGYNDSQVESLAAQSSPNVSSIDSKLRAYFKDMPATVTTYTYKPLVGMLSMTDPSGIVTKYEYDSFGRLIKVANEDKLVETYDYHYAIPSALVLPPKIEFLDIRHFLESGTTYTTTARIHISKPCTVSFAFAYILSPNVSGSLTIGNLFNKTLSGSEIGNTFSLNLPAGDTAIEIRLTGNLSEAATEAVGLIITGTECSYLELGNCSLDGTYTWTIPPPVIH